MSWFVSWLHWRNAGRIIERIADGQEAKRIFPVGSHLYTPKGQVPAPQGEQGSHITGVAWGSNDPFALRVATRLSFCPHLLWTQTRKHMLLQQKYILPLPLASIVGKQSGTWLSQRTRISGCKIISPLKFHLPKLPCKGSRCSTSVD